MWSYWRSRLSLQACCGIAVTSWNRTCKRHARSNAESFRVEAEKIGDAVDRHVWWGSGLGFRCVMALTYVDRRRPRSETFLGEGKERRLVIDVNVMIRRKAALDLGEVILLVLVDEDVAPCGQ